MPNRPLIAAIGCGGTISSLGRDSMDVLDYPDFGTNSATSTATACRSIGSRGAVTRPTRNSTWLRSRACRASTSPIRTVVPTGQLWTRWLQPAPAESSRLDWRRAFRLPSSGPPWSAPATPASSSCNRAALAVRALPAPLSRRGPHGCSRQPQSAEGAHPADARTGADPRYRRDPSHVHGLLTGSGSRVQGPATDWAAEST